MKQKMNHKKKNRNGKMKEKQEIAQLSSVKIEQLSKMPIIENSVKKSEDGKLLIHKTTITDIKAVSYFEKVLARGS